MTKINFEQAREFLENIKPTDNVAIIHHNDLDGFSSGILIYKFCKTKTNNITTFESETKEGSIKQEEIKDFDVIIITDIPPFFIGKNLESLNQKKILYIDHHQPDTQVSEFIQEYRISEKYFPASRMCFELTKKENKENEWIAIAGIVADYGWAYEENQEIINQFLEKENISLDDYKKKVVYKINNFLIYFKDEKKAFDILSKIKDWKNLERIEKYSDKVQKEIDEKEKDFHRNKEKFGDINLYFIESKFDIKSVVISKIASENPKEIFIFATPFPKDNEMLRLSARHQSEKANLPSLLKQVMEGLENSRVGGHLRAAGGFIQTKDLSKFKENLKAIFYEEKPSS